jgi:hypothetical protein
MFPMFSNGTYKFLAQLYISNNKKCLSMQQEIRPHFNGFPLGCYCHHNYNNLLERDLYPYDRRELGILTKLRWSKKNPHLTIGIGTTHCLTKSDNTFCFFIHGNKVELMNS